MGLLESIRRWIDGETGNDPIATVAEDAQPRRVWEEFLVRIAREVERVMQREMFTPPGGQTFIPREYIVYLSPDDDKEWRGEKRRGLEQGLHHVLSERARELAGQTALATKSFAVELRVDATLAQGEFRVQPVWEESETNRTMVMSRPEEPAATNAKAGEFATQRLTQAAEPEAAANIENEVTQVRARPAPLYEVEVWKDGVRQTIVPVVKPEITIGRGSQSVPVDLPLKNDPEVSRVHALLTRDAAGRYWLTARGRNTTSIAGREAPREERTPLAPDDKVEICSYTLRVRQP